MIVEMDWFENIGLSEAGHILLSGLEIMVAVDADWISACSGRIVPNSAVVDQRGFVVERTVAVLESTPVVDTKIAVLKMDCKD